MTIRLRSLWLLALALLAFLLPFTAFSQIAVLSSTVEEKVMSPGGKYSANIVVSNPTRDPQVARIYQTDYTFSADGTSNFADPGTLARSNAQWITPQTTRITIPAGGQVTVPYSVAVPAADSLRGTYWSCVMVEGVPNTPVADSTATVGVGSVMRYAVQIATHIQSTGSRTAKFENPNPTKSDSGVAMFEVDVVDAGERGFRPTVWIEVYDAQGVLKAKVKQERGLLFPGTSLHQKFELGKLAPGVYKALVFADTGEDAVFAAQYSITY